MNMIQKIIQIKDDFFFLNLQGSKTRFLIPKKSNGLKVSSES